MWWDGSGGGAGLLAPGDPLGALVLSLAACGAVLGLGVGAGLWWVRDGGPARWVVSWVGLCPAGAWRGCGEGWMACGYWRAWDLSCVGQVGGMWGRGSRVGLYKFFMLTLSV